MSFNNSWNVGIFWHVEAITLRHIWWEECTAVKGGRPSWPHMAVPRIGPCAMQGYYNYIEARTVHYKVVKCLCVERAHKQTLVCACVGGVRLCVI